MESDKYAVWKISAIRTIHKGRKDFSPGGQRSSFMERLEKSDIFIYSINIEPFLCVKHYYRF